MPFKGATSRSGGAHTGDIFIINGRPFSGTGNGWNPATGILDAKDSNSREFALLPNPVFYSPTGDYKADSIKSQLEIRGPLRRLGRREHRLQHSRLSKHVHGVDQSHAQLSACR